MAKVAKPRKKSADVHTFPAPDSPAAVAVAEGEAPEPETDDEPAPEDPVTPYVSRGFKRRDPVPKAVGFFDRAASIPKADWGIGVRATIRVYRLEPIIDQLRGSNNKYITIYEEPVTEQKLKVDHGSGRYRLYLNYKDAGVKEGKELDSIEIDILDPNHPPKIPPGAWVDDVRNKNWAWAKASMQPIAQAAAAAAADPMHAFDTFIRIQDQVSDRMKPADGAPRKSATEEAAALLDVVDRVVSRNKPADNGDSTLLREELRAMRTEVAEARARGDRLMEKMMDQAREKPADSNGLGTLRDIMNTVKEFLPMAKDFLPAAAEAVVRREKEPWWTGILQTGIEAVAPALPMLANGFMQRAAQQQQQNPVIITGPQALPAPGQPQQQPQGNGQPDLFSMLYTALQSDASGEDFAESINTLYGPMLYKQACMLGEAGLLTMLKGHAIWNQLGPLQAKMPAFIAEFIAYGKEDDGEPEPAEDNQDSIEIPSHAEAAPVDLTGGAA